MTLPPCRCVEFGQAPGAVLTVWWNGQFWRHCHLIRGRYFWWVQVFWIGVMWDYEVKGESDERIVT